MGQEMSTCSIVFFFQVEVFNSSLHLRPHVREPLERGDMPEDTKEDEQPAEPGKPDTQLIGTIRSMIPTTMISTSRSALPEESRHNTARHPLPVPACRDRMTSGHR